MMSLLVQIGFGLVVIAAAFCFFVFTRAFLDEEKRTDSRYRTVAGAMAVSCVGIGMWAFNPLMQSFGGESLPIVGMVIASALILIGKSALVGSTAMGGNKRTFKAFMLACALWIFLCVVVSTVVTFS